MATIIEPFRIKVVEPIRMTTREEREAALAAAGHNLFRLAADDVLLDWLTDSGTSAMSQEQWSGVMRGDESYAGSHSWQRFERAVRELTGFQHIVPTHQGRAAEHILFSILGGEGKTVPNNTHFDTTRANVEMSGAKALDLPCPESRDPAHEAPFKGNIDVAALEDLLATAAPGQVPLVLVTVTNNSGGGQPVSLENLRQVRALCDRYGIPLYLDACRFAENAWLIREREPGQGGRTPREIAQEMFSLADGCTFSAKKDAFANIGGFLCTNDPELAREERNLLILTEGFPTYGGLAGRDLEAIAVGLDEILHEDYLEYRLASVRYLNDHLHRDGVPVMRPAGGHAVYLDAGRLLPHIPAHQYPGQSLALELYREGGIRGCEIGTVMFGRAGEAGAPDETAPHELVRLAIPRRVYTQSHVDYAIERIVDVAKRADSLRGLKIIEQPPFLRHFTAVFAPL